MSRSFHVVPASDTLVLDPGGTGEVTYNVTNARTASTRVRVAVVPLRESQKEWYELADDAERLFSGGETVQVKVRVQVPASTPAGQFGFRLDALEADATDEPGGEGQSVGVEWAPPQGDGKKPFPWWIVAVAAGLLLLGGGVALFFALRSGGVELIALEGLPYSEARAWVEEQELVLAEVQELREEESDRVLAQEPEPGAVLEPGATVTLTRAMPWVDVVDLRGLRSTEAVAALQRQGLAAERELERGPLARGAAELDQHVDPVPGAARGVGQAEGRDAAVLGRGRPVQRRAGHPPPVRQPLQHRRAQGRVAKDDHGRGAARDGAGRKLAQQILDRGRRRLGGAPGQAPLEE